MIWDAGPRRGAAPPDCPGRLWLRQMFSRRRSVTEREIPPDAAASLVRSLTGPYSFPCPAWLLVAAAHGVSGGGEGSEKDAPARRRKGLIIAEAAAAYVESLSGPQVRFGLLLLDRAARFLLAGAP